jgi:TPR repeat protein
LRNCAAQQATFQPNGMQQGVELERAGRYAEAAAAYQAHLNASGHPDGDGYVAGERLGYLYANGRGIPRDVARARKLFSANSLERNRIDFELLNHGILPATPEDKTPTLMAQTNAIIDREAQARVQAQI